MKNKKTVAVIGAMDCEIDKIKDILTDLQTFQHNKANIFLGNVNGNNIIISKCGVGKASAALNTQFIIDTFKPDYIINTGIAGGINPNLKIYDTVIGEKLVQHDFDATALGYAPGYMCNGIEPKKPTVYYSNKNLIELFHSLDLKTNVFAGIIATGDMFVSSVQKKKELREIFGADAVEMEAAAIAQAANLSNIPCLVIRTIADMADENAAVENKSTETMLAEYSTISVIKLLEVL